jgi:hypothetical protein
MYKYVVGTSQNGLEIYTNIINSAAGRYFSRRPHLIKLAKDIIELVDMKGPTIALSSDFGRIIGNTNIVNTDDNDTVFYAHAPKKASVQRFVKNRSMDPSQELALVLKRDAEGNYEIVDAWIGPLCPPFPGSDGATTESKAYWDTHALVAGSETIDMSSISRVSPY